MSSKDNIIIYSPEEIEAMTKAAVALVKNA